MCKKGGEEKKCTVHVFGTTITDSVRTAIPTRRIFTHTRRTVIHIMCGTIPGLGTATAPMDIRTIADQSIETRKTKSSTDGARLLFSQDKLRELKTQAGSPRAVRNQIAFMISLTCCFALSLICWSSLSLPNSPRLRSTISKSLSMSCRSPVSSARIFPVSNFDLDPDSVYA